MTLFRWVIKEKEPKVGKPNMLEEDGVVKR